MTKKRLKKPKEPEGKKKNKKDVKEYGVVLTKQEKYRHRIYPQKGKPPEEDKEDDSYKIV